MFDTEKIAIQALQRADETKAIRKNASRRTAAILGVCTVSLGGFFLAFSSGILPRTDENTNINIDDALVPLAALPNDEITGINLGGTELTLIKEDSAVQYSVTVVGEDDAYTFYIIDVVSEDDAYTLETIPDGRYRIMVGNIEIGSLIVIEGTPEISLK